jgi:hypothetical protein
LTGLEAGISDTVRKLYENGTIKPVETDFVVGHVEMMSVLFLSRTDFPTFPGHVGSTADYLCKTLGRR